MPNWSVSCFVLLVGTVICGGATAQELVPRAYWPAPVGTNVFVLGYQRNTGDIVIDPSLPVTGVESNIDYLQVSYQRSFDLFGRSASAQFTGTAVASTCAVQTPGSGSET